MANPQIRIIELPTAGTLTPPVTNYFIAIESSADGAAKVAVNTFLTQAAASLYTNRVGSTTDNGIARFDGTTGLLQGSSATISDGGVITAAGFNSTSSERYKINISRLQNSLNIISCLEGVTYNPKHDLNSQEVGLIAEKVNVVLPQVVHKNLEGQPESIDYSRLVAVLINAVNELHAKVTALEESKLNCHCK